MRGFLSATCALTFSGAIAAAVGAMQVAAETHNSQWLWGLSASLGLLCLASGFGLLLTGRPDQPKEDRATVSSVGQRGGQTAHTINNITQGSADSSDPPQFTVHPVQDDRTWMLEITNEGGSDDFLVEVVSVGSPVNWNRRYPAPWREMTKEQNQGNLGWQLIPGQSSRAVNLFGWVTKEENAQVFLRERTNAPEVLYVYSAIHPRGYGDFKIAAGELIETLVEVRPKRALSGSPFRFWLTVDDQGMTLSPAPF